MPFFRLYYRQYFYFPRFVLFLVHFRVHFRAGIFIPYSFLIQLQSFVFFVTIWLDLHLFLAYFGHIEI